ncbi:TPA: hypothetical protein R1886_000067 [Klebsiella oxytoca]|nr:hypothetical protein [Klebsiella oxytoca]
MTTDITELAQSLKRRAASANEFGEGLFFIKADDVLALVEALEKAQKSNEFLKGQLSELANFNPDWDKLEASYESWREIAAELLVAKERIAELESRLNSADKLQDSAFRSGLQHGFSLGQTDDQKGYEQSVAAYSPAAGIKWEAE